jgi:hypothetical protein
MQKQLDPKAFIIILGIAALIILFFGWRAVFAPKPGEEGPPPASTMPKPPAPPGTYFPPGGGAAVGGPAAPNPANLEQDMRRK